MRLGKFREVSFRASFGFIPQSVCTSLASDHSVPPSRLPKTTHSRDGSNERCDDLTMRESVKSLDRVTDGHGGCGSRAAQVRDGHGLRVVKFCRG